ncbi:MAG: hypothetical protein JNM93_04670 [Bacteriovoracaceae bacterium]|nr:hypothetical protein [Bacteriovoracaceae bacterium]
MKVFVFTYLVLISMASAMDNMTDLLRSPPSIPLSNKKAIFVDFQKADYQLNYDYNARQLYIHSKIIFYQPEVGSPIYDLLPTESEIYIDGQKSSAHLVYAPGNVTQYKVLGDQLAVGLHTLEIKHYLNTLVVFENDGVSSAFWMSDLSDRRYLEQFLPTNLEYDRYAMTFYVNFLNFPKQQLLYTNGVVFAGQAYNQYVVQFPTYFTTSSVFFHTSFVGKFNHFTDTYKTIDGRVINILVYNNTGTDLTSYLKLTKSVLAELENDYGQWPHGNITIYAAGSGGMEYCGATMTSYWALPHEITHSYFARGIIPANGNAGWIDEAIASFRDDRYQKRMTPGFNSSQMAGHSVYSRYTDDNAYTLGKRFMEYLNYQEDANGGLKPFLKYYKDKWLHVPYFTQDFINELNAYTGKNYQSDFNRFIYGINQPYRFFEGSTSLEKSFGFEDQHENPHHPKLNLEDLEKLL